MKQSTYDKAFATTMLMLESKNLDMKEKVIYLGSGCYLLITVDRVTREDMSKGKYTSEYYVGEPIKLTYQVLKRNCEELYRVELPYPKESEILEELPRITHMYA